MTRFGDKPRVGSYSPNPMKINGELAEAARILDQYYMTTRYPDALPGGAPCDMFVRSQADEALRLASLFIHRVQAELDDA